MNTRHQNLTPNQVQNRVANFIAFTVILSWLLMLGLFNLVNQSIVKAELINQPPASVNNDENLSSSKPVDWWRLNSNWYSQRYVYLSWNTSDDRSVQLLNAYWFDWVGVWALIKKIGDKHSIRPEMFICIMYADSSLWKFLKTTHNYGNVGNNDRWDRVHFETMEQWIDAIARYALNWKYLKHKYTVDYLSPALGHPWPYYATSKENWHINVTNCLWMIHDKKIEDNRHFRQ